MILTVLCVTHVASSLPSGVPAGERVSRAEAVKNIPKEHSFASVGQWNFSDNVYDERTYMMIEPLVGAAVGNGEGHSDYSDISHHITSYHIMPPRFILYHITEISTLTCRVPVTEVPMNDTQLPHLTQSHTFIFRISQPSVTINFFVQRPQAAVRDTSLPPFGPLYD